MFFLVDTEATQQFGFYLGQNLTAGSVLLLEGNLGSGKTTFVQGLGKGLGIAESIDSPTFTLINEYFGGRLPLYHVDLYRLEPPEIVALSLESYWEGVELEPGILAIEWADRLPYRPENYLQIQLFHNPEVGRQAALKAIGQFDLDSLNLPEFKEIDSPRHDQA